MSNFRDAEFYCPCWRADCDGKGKGPHRLLRLYLDRAREMLGAPIMVTSGNRCAAHNADVHGEDKSEHVYPEGCIGADLHVADSRARWALLDACRHAGFTRFVFYAKDDHIHVGIGDSFDAEAWPPNVIAVR